MDTKKTTRDIIITITIIIILFTLFYKTDLPYNEIHKLKPTNIITIITLTIISSIINAKKIRYFQKIYNYKINWKNSYALTITNSVTNFVSIGQSGLIIKAIYLYKKCKLKITKYISIIAATMYTQLILNTIIGIITIIIIKLQYNTWNWYITGAFILYLNALLIFYIPTQKITELTKKIIKPTKKTKTKNKIIQKITQIAKGWENYKKNKKNITGLLKIEIIYIIIATIRLIYAFNVYGIKIPITHALILITISNLAIYINIFNWLGFGEIITITTTKLLGYNLTTTINIILTTKLIAIFTYCILGMYFAPKIINQIITTKNKTQKKIQNDSST